MPTDTAALLSAGLSIFLFLALCAALVLVVVCLRRPATIPLAVAGGLMVLGVVVSVVSPVNVPMIVGLMLALLGITLAALGGDPFTRRVLDVATGGRVRETPDGGILIAMPTATGGSETMSLLRGGATVGYLERVATAVAIVAGFPEAIAVVVAIKGIGRFSELATSEARERFLIGTLASLLWACLVAGLVRLAIW